MNNSRIIGNNISLELTKQSIDITEFGKKIGFSVSDVHKLVEGRLFIPPLQLSKIAEVLGITKAEIIEKKEMAEYNSLVHNFRNFKQDESQELVLDLIDMYADLAEAL